jgi:hypothetical protein
MGLLVLTTARNSRNGEKSPQGVLRSLGSAVSADIVSGIEWTIELEPEVEDWLDALGPRDFATASFHVDRLATRGASLRMPHSRALGDGLFELRFDLDRTAWRITFWFAPGRRIVLLTVFRKQRMTERVEVERARRAMALCVDEAHTAEEVGDGPDDVD